MALSITDEARRILATPLGQQPGCTYVASKADWMRAAQEAIDGETADLEFLLDEESSEPWLCNAESAVVVDAYKTSPTAKDVNPVPPAVGSNESPDWITVNSPL